jgi:hypothetical protein
MLNYTEQHLGWNGLERTNLPPEPQEFVADKFASGQHNVLRAAILEANDSQADLSITMSHFSSDPLMEMTRQMIMKYSAEEIEALLNEGLTSTIFTVPAAYVSL